MSAAVHTLGDRACRYALAAEALLEATKDMIDAEAVRLQAMEAQS